jgi:hypothetical protein
MRLLRRRRYLRHVALFALAIQAIATFGHVHADPAAHQRAGLEARTFFASLTQMCLPGLPEHADCTICAAINLLGASAMPQTAGVPIVDLRFAGLLPRDAYRPPEVPTSAFEARGPPPGRLA